MQTIASKGHEIACHSLQDDLALNTLSLADLKTNITVATDLLRDEIGHRPTGFRAPKCSITPACLEILETMGYIYDSSIHPTMVPNKYNYLTYPISHYYPSKNEIGRHGDCNILEIPISVMPTLRLPIGWWWMRNLGVGWTIWGSKYILSKNDYVVFYFHPWELVNLPKDKGISWSYRRNSGKKMYEMLEKYIRFFKNHARFLKMHDLAMYLKNKTY